MNIVITGASGGIGRFIVKAFLDRGGRVLLVSRRQDELERIKKDFLQNSPQAFWVSGESAGITGKILSAVHDHWEELSKHVRERFSPPMFIIFVVLS